MPEALNDHLLIRPDPEETEHHGILVQRRDVEGTLSGVVVSQGPKVEESLEGRRVYFGKYSGLDIYYADTKFLCLRESELLCADPSDDLWVAVPDAQANEAAGVTASLPEPAPAPSDQGSEPVVEWGG